MRVWLDDIREKPADFDIWVKTASECIELLKTGNVSFIDFDHDLGDEDPKNTGYTVAYYIMEHAYYGDLPPLVNYHIHSSNPVGTNNIRYAMEQAYVYWMERNFPKCETL